jgi:hypothetical protein
MRHKSESSRPNHVLEDVLLGEASDAFNQVLVRVPIAGEHLAHGWDHLQQESNLFSQQLKDLKTET